MHWLNAWTTAILHCSRATSLKDGAPEEEERHRFVVVFGYLVAGRASLRLRSFPGHTLFL